MAQQSSGCSESATRRITVWLSFPEHDPWNRQPAVNQGTFCFLNETRELGRPVDWQPDASLLWQFNLHYFDYLHLLDGGAARPLSRMDRGESPRRRTGMASVCHVAPHHQLVQSWVRGSGHPASLYQQAAHLHRNLETHLLGNHLLENARALVFAGCFFGAQGEAPRWLERGLDLYREQTPEQVLGDGGHFERSPMYHALILEGYLDVLNLLPADHPDRAWLADTARRMADFLRSVTHPNGQIALFNDATQEIAVPTKQLCRYVKRVTGYEPTPRKAFPETGYFVHRGENCYLVVDGGPIGPDYLPAHAHAEAGDMRDYVRSTRAHNTICVDSVDQAECWHSFRVARRYAPFNVSSRRDADGCRFEGTFDGYAHLIGDEIVHRRVVGGDNDQRVLQISDHIDGQGDHKVESFIHLHPEVECIIRGGEAVLQRDGKRLTIQVDDTVFYKEKGWYCPEFGKRIENDVLVLRVEKRLPQRLSYTIQY